MITDNMVAGLITAEVLPNQKTVLQKALTE